MEILRELQSNNAPRSIVTLMRDSQGAMWAMKVQPKTLCDNEQWALEVMADTGYVPKFIRQDQETLLIAYHKPTPIASPNIFLSHRPRILQAMHEREVRHGDLSHYSIIPYYDVPILIDWAECRHLSDPRPDKRIEGDAYWLTKSLEVLCQKSK